MPKISPDGSEISYTSSVINDAVVGDIVDQLRHNMRLKKIDLSYLRPHPSDVKIKHIAGALQLNTVLVCVELSRNQLGKKALKTLIDALRFNVVLRRLVLSNNQIDDAGAKQIAAMLMVNKSIRSIDLARNNINDAGTEALAKVLAVTTTLVILQLAYNSFSEKGVRALAVGIQENINTRYVCLGDIDGCLPEYMSAARILMTANSRNFEIYKIVADEPGTPEVCEKLRCLVAQSLPSDRPLDEKIFRHKLKLIIDVKGRELFPDYFSAEQREKIGRALTPNEQKAIKAFDRFKNISLARFGCSPGQPLSLKDKVWLTIERQRMPIDQTFRNDNILTEFRQLSFFGHPPQSARSAAYMLEAGGRSIDLSKINKLYESHVLDDIAPPLESTHALKTLILRAPSVSCASFAVLVAGLSLNNSVKTLDLTGSKLRDEGAAALSALLKTNKAIEVVILSENEVGDLGIELLAHALAMNGSIKQLALSNNNFKSGGAKALGNMIKVNATLEALSVSDNELGDQGVEFLALSLRDNSTLRKLNLHMTGFGDSGMSKIIDMLHINVALETFVFSKNIISSHTFELFFNMLALNQTLSSVVMGVCVFHPSALRSFAHCIATNRVLTKIDFFHTTAMISPAKEWETVAMAYRENLTLYGFSFGEHPSYNDHEIAISNLLSPPYVRNKRIYQIVKEESGHSQVCQELRSLVVQSLPDDVKLDEKIFKSRLAWVIAAVGREYFPNYRSAEQVARLGRTLTHTEQEAIDAYNRFKKISFARFGCLLDEPLSLQDAARLAIERHQQPIDPRSLPNRDWFAGFRVNFFEPVVALDQASSSALASPVA